MDKINIGLKGEFSNENPTFIKSMCEIIKNVVDACYDQEMIFYDENYGWYSRYHGRYITVDELREFVYDCI